MRVMIAYDGSVYADVAIRDLTRAGLHRDSEVLLAAVVDPATNTPPLSEFDLLSAASRRMDAVLAHVRHQKAQALEDARAMVSKVASEIRPHFPEGKIRFDVLEGTPADELLGKAASWEPDLIIAGSHGRTTIGRFFLGSVSKSIAEKAQCSVRVAREGFEKTDAEPVELIIAATNPVDTKVVAESIAQRVWDKGTRLHVVAVEERSTANIFTVDLDGKSIYEQAAVSLTDAGMQVSIRTESGDPNSIWLEAAADSRADAIFVAGRRSDDSGTDELAVGLVTGANCTVEIVR